MSVQLPMRVGRSEGEKWHLFGDTYICKVPAEATSGTYAVFEEIVPPGGSVPLHLHRQTDEYFHVLEGSLRVRCANDHFLAEPGMIVTVPVGTPHAFRNEGDHDCRLLATVMPGNFINFFREIASLLQDQQTDPKVVIAIYSRYHSEVLE